MHDDKIKNMEEFSAIVGLSRPTVSKFFNDPKSVKKSTRLRIEQALEQHDYRPNLYAVNQNRRATRNIGIVVPYLADPFFAEIARRIEQTCLAAGYSPYLFSAHGSVDLEKEIFENLRSMRPAGVMLAPLGRVSNRSAVERLCADVPTVLFDSNIEGAGEAFFGSDNLNFVSQSVQYLCRTGEPPWFYEMPPVNPNANKRRNAYIQAMEDLGFEPVIKRVEGKGWGFEEIGYAGAMQLIENRALPSTTVLCSNDRLAIGFLAACYEKGLTVGHGPKCDLRVAGHDDHPFSKFACPPLTTIAQDYEKISQMGFAKLIDLIESGSRGGPRSETLLEGKLVLRASA